MDIYIERPLAELGRGGLWSAFQDSFNWIVYSFMLIIAAFILESSVTTAKGSISVTLGGPVSWLGLAGAAGLCMHTIRKRKAANKVFCYSEKTKGDEVCFYRFSETGFLYGVSNVWTVYWTWELVTRIHFRLHSIDLELPRAILKIRTEFLKPGELGELKEFFIKQREIIRPEPFFGWRRSNVGKESFGPMKG